MRQPQNAKRGRGRGRRGNGNNHHNHVPNRNTSYESNGPDVKLRGNAQQLHEKYMALAHDAASAGERISAEAYTQFADHYFRLHQAAVGVAETKRQQDQAAAAVSAEAAAGDADNGEAGAGEVSSGDILSDGNDADATPAVVHDTADTADVKPARRRGRQNGKSAAAADDADVRHFDPLAALDGGLDGLDCWRILCPQIATLLADAGAAFVEIGAGQGKAVGRLGVANKLCVAGSFADLSGHERCLQFQKEI